MRPFLRGDSPIKGDFNDYRDAFDDLLIAIGNGQYKGITLAQYCSYCERVLPTNLAIEHIEPKDGLFGKPLLKNKWTNFLLACVNCNSTKGSKELIFTKVYLPDRDNTFYAFDYSPKGLVIPNKSMGEEQRDIALETIKLLGLNAGIGPDGTQVSKDRRKQRINAYLSAIDSLEDFEANPLNPAIEGCIVKSMITTGYFSVWMEVFKNHHTIRAKFIAAINGTSASGCFNLLTQPITPHPNKDGLLSGGKI